MRQGSSYSPGGMSVRFTGPITPVLKVFIIACIAGFMAQSLWPSLTTALGLVPVLFWQGMVWQVVTFNFVHGGLFHIFFNLLVLSMFAGELELVYGRRRFIIFMTIAGIGAGLTMAVTSPNLMIPVVGCSGIVYGVLLAYGLLYPNRIVLFFFVLPMKIKHMVLLLGGIELWSTISGQDNGVAHLAHLGGMLFGYLYLRYDKIYMRMRQRYYASKLKKLRGRFYVARPEDDDKPPTFH